jgi:hypothetical protein
VVVGDSMSVEVRLAEGRIRFLALQKAKAKT